MASSSVNEQHNRDCAVLRTQCLREHQRIGQLSSRLALMAALIAGIYTALAIGGGLGFLMGLGVCWVTGNLLNQAYDRFRNRTYYKVAEALELETFRLYLLQEKKIPYDLITITTAYLHFLVDCTRYPAERTSVLEVNL